MFSITASRLTQPAEAYTSTLDTDSSTLDSEALQDPVKVLNPLNENLKLRAENFQLKSQLLSCRVEEATYSSKIENEKLTAERLRLEKEFRQELKPNEKTIFNWSTFTFDPDTEFTGKK